MFNLDGALLEIEELTCQSGKFFLSLVLTVTGRMKKIVGRLNLHYQDGREEQDQPIFGCGPNHVCLGKICNIYQNNLKKS